MARNDLDIVKRFLNNEPISAAEEVVQNNHREQISNYGNNSGVTFWKPLEVVQTSFSEEKKTDEILLKMNQ